jgi:hypothetical protein
MSWPICAVALGAQHFHAHQDRPPAFIQRQRLRYGRILRGQDPHRIQDRLPVLAHEFNIQHDPLPLLTYQSVQNPPRQSSFDRLRMTAV